MFSIRTSGILLCATLCILVVSAIVSCNKGHQACCSEPQIGTFYIHLHSNIDTNEVDDTTALYADAAGRHISLNTARFFMSSITLVNANGTTYTFPGISLLKIIDSEAYLIGKAPVGTYTSVYFTIGLDSATNALSPSAFNPVTYISPTAMWYGNATQGYYFMELIGSADTTATQTGVNPVPFCYKIGGGANRKTVHMPVRSTGTAYLPWILTANSTQYIHMVCDYGKLLSVLDFKTQDSTDYYTMRPGIADTIALNVPNMFRYEE